MKLFLNRIIQNEKNTIGVFIYKDIPVCYSLELPWKENAKRISSIPAGTYNLLRFTHPKYGEVYHLKDVPERSEILIHGGNYLSETKGCILPGYNIQPQFDGNMISQSRSALSELLGFKADKLVIK